jgi:nucleolar protein 53
MGKRKQKRQWRKIDTQEVRATAPPLPGAPCGPSPPSAASPSTALPTQVDDALEKETREERQGLAVEGIPDGDLFYVDAAPAAAGAAAAAPPARLARKLAARARPTRAQAILAGAHAARPVATPLRLGPKPAKLAAAPPGGVVARVRAAVAGAGAALGLWADAGAPVRYNTADDDTGRAKRRRPAGPAAASAPAVAVDGPGCSFNPDREQHQEAVAVAVAAEMKKIYDRELRPTAPAATVGAWGWAAADGGDELAALQVDAAAESEEEAPAAPLGAAGAESDGEGRGGGAPRRAAPKTAKDRARAARRRGEEAALAARRAARRRAADLANLPAVGAEVDGVLAARAARVARRRADAAERAAAAPPRLGRLRYEAPPLQVLSTEELDEGGGSLLRLKPTPSLAREHFKALQRRGAIEPRRPANARRGKRVEFVHGTRADRALERQAEVEELRRARRDAARGAERAAGRPGGAGGA